MSSPSKEVLLVSFLDKEFLPQHSFVEGMLTKVLPRRHNVKSILVTAKNSEAKRSCYKYNGAICFPVLPAYSLGMIGKIQSALVVFLFVFYLRKKFKGNLVILVRNNPFYLLGASLNVFVKADLIYQNSFPLERTHRKRWKRFIHSRIINLASFRVKKVLAVSPLALNRVRRLVGRQAEGLSIPLLCDFTIPDVPSFRKPADPLRFVYIGTHDKSRQLDVVLCAIIKVLGCENLKREVVFEFIGGSESDVEVLIQVEEVRKYVEQGKIIFTNKLPRNVVEHKLSAADVGLSLIPVNELFRESSPTKLVEYLGKGLAVLASKGIDLQETYTADSKAGALVEFEIASMSAGIYSLISMSDDEINKMKLNAINYSRRHLTYEVFSDQLYSFMRK